MGIKKIKNLSPCPFCGGEAKAYEIIEKINKVKCTHCLVVTAGFGTLSHAINCWNRRGGEWNR